MKDFMVLVGIILFGIICLVLLVGDMPNATFMQLVAEKIVALALCFVWYKIVKITFKF